MNINYQREMMKQGWFIVFNSTFNSISVLSWQSVLSKEYPEKTTDLSQVTVSHNVVSSTPHLNHVSGDRH